MSETPLVYETVHPGDGEYIATLEDPLLREAAFCTVTTYRQPEKLKVGDPVPAVELTEMTTGAKISTAVQFGKPLFLIFGSYT